MTLYNPSPNDWVLMYNNYTGDGTFLSATSPSGGLLQMSSSTGSSSYWQFFTVDQTYYIRNKAAGSSLQLGVIFSNQVPMPLLQAADSNTAGQQWSLLSNNIFWNIESKGAGSSVQLDTYSDTLQPFFESPGHSGQLWRFRSVGSVDDVAFSTVFGAQATASGSISANPTAAASSAGAGSAVTVLGASTSQASTAGAVTSQFSSTDTAKATQASSPLSSSPAQSTAQPTGQTLDVSTAHSLSTGAIGGIAAGAAVIGMLVAIAIGIFLWRRKSRNAQLKPVFTPVPVPAEQRGMTTAPGAYQSNYSNTMQKREEEGPQVAEIGGDAVRRPQLAFTELPGDHHR